MQANAEIIAVVSARRYAKLPAALQDFVATGTMLLVRHADGRMSLESARREQAFIARMQPTDYAYKSSPFSIRFRVKCSL